MTFAQLHDLYRKWVSFNCYGPSAGQLAHEIRESIRWQIAGARSDAWPVSRDCMREMRGELMRVSSYINAMRSDLHFPDREAADFSGQGS